MRSLCPCTLVQNSTLAKYRSDWNLKTGDEVEVIGSEVKFYGGDVLMAVEGTKDDKRVILRKYSGQPVWDVSTPEFWSR